MTEKTSNKEQKMTRKRMRELALGALAFVAAVLILYFTGIGCPIKFATGISCPGCGMTRAWLAALQGNFGLAFAMHPLFWCVPLAFALVLFWDKLPGKTADTIGIILIVALAGLWIVRMALWATGNPPLFPSYPETQDVVSAGLPGWLKAFLNLF